MVAKKLIDELAEALVYFDKSPDFGTNSFTLWEWRDDGLHITEIPPEEYMNWPDPSVRNDEATK